jgi:hypothetical protein
VSPKSGFQTGGRWPGGRWSVVGGLWRGCPVAGGPVVARRPVARLPGGRWRGCQVAGGAVARWPVGQWPVARWRGGAVAGSKLHSISRNEPIWVTGAHQGLWRLPFLTCGDSPPPPLYTLARDFHEHPTRCRPLTRYFALINGLFRTT